MKGIIILLLKLTIIGALFIIFSAPVAVGLKVYLFIISIPCGIILWRFIPSFVDYVLSYLKGGKKMEEGITGLLAVFAIVGIIVLIAIDSVPLFVQVFRIMVLLTVSLCAWRLCWFPGDNPIAN